MSEELIVPNLQASTMPDRQVRIAREIAMGMRELPDILKAHAIMPDEFERMRADPRFDDLLKELIREWNGAKNTEARIKMKAGVSLEESLMNFHQSMNNANEPLNHRVEVAKFLAKVAGIGEQAQGPTGGGFSVTINIGGGHAPKVVNSPTVIEHE